MIRFFHSTYQIYFDSFSFLLSEKLLFEGIYLIICFRYFGFCISFCFSSSVLLPNQNIFYAFSIHWFWSFSIEIWFSFGWILLYFDFVICSFEGTFVETFLRVLPVHWYHLFVSIRYHNKMHFARCNIVQTNENVVVQNTDLRTKRTNPDWQSNRDLIRYSCWAAFRPPLLFMQFH